MQSMCQTLTNKIEDLELHIEEKISGRIAGSIHEKVSNCVRREIDAFGGDIQGQINSVKVQISQAENPVSSNPVDKSFNIVIRYLEESEREKIDNRVTDKVGRLLEEGLKIRDFNLTKVGRKQTRG
ncbi:hypothetical protein SNE40_009809 [Patella caerulea]|uniref:Uncharacterized protein n=1 Tax=Patella caerulea TaxID=87958 RepID=A0AAN8JWH2_PATCE